MIDGSVLAARAARSTRRPTSAPHPTGRPRSRSRWPASWWSAASRSSPTCCRRHQRMNASFDRLHLVNTYGAFGSVTKVRREVIIEGTLDERPRARHRVARVRGARQARRRAAAATAGRAVPPAPRLAAVVRRPLAVLRRRAGSVRCSSKLLEADPATLALFDHDPFDGATARRSCGPGCSATSSRPGRSGGRPAPGGDASRPAILQAPMGFARR